MPLNGKVIEYILRHYCNYTTQDFRDPKISWKRCLDMAKLAWVDHQLHRFDMMFREDPTKKISPDGNIKQMKNGFTEITFEGMEKMFKIPQENMKRLKKPSW